MDLIIESIGWTGAILVLWAYYANSTGKMDASSTIYQILNLLGALCLIVHTFWNHAYPSMVVNIIWSAIALVSWSKSLKKFDSRQK